MIVETLNTISRIFGNFGLSFENSFFKENFVNLNYIYCSVLHIILQHAFELFSNIWDFY